mmetsp:Transcript_20275/g.53014  ORF Transcript_20275/g.53014 Transcript_20275/m.53014 type:complete len:217 (+) Transcript_20275:1426-2076(+)
MLLQGLHLVKDLNSLFGLPAPDARVDHAAVGDCVRLLSLLLHLLPQPEHRLDITSLTVGLHQDAKRHMGGLDLKLLHGLEGGLEAGNILHATVRVQQGVEKDLVGFLRLLLQKSFHQSHTALNLGGIPIPSCIGERPHEHARDGEAVRRQTRSLHLLERIPCLVDALPPHEIFQRGDRGVASSSSAILALLMLLLLLRRQRLRQAGHTNETWNWRC